MHKIGTFFLCNVTQKQKVGKAFYHNMRVNEGFAIFVKSIKKFTFFFFFLNSLTSLFVLVVGAEEELFLA